MEFLAKARLYARYVMTPWAAKSLPVNKEALRYKILSGVSVQEIQTWIENKKLKGEEFEEPTTPHPRDEILMVSIHRPDILKMLIATCSGNEGEPNGTGLNTAVNAKNSFGKTALMYAAQYGFMESIKILLAAGADINAQTNEGNLTDEYCMDDICIINGRRTALMYAVQEGNLDIAKYLVANGADINLAGSKGMTVYDYLSGEAPYWGNFRASAAATYTTCTPPDKHENKNVTPKQSVDFVSFLKRYPKIH